jgi:hypothetical protein
LPDVRLDAQIDAGLRISRRGTFLDRNARDSIPRVLLDVPRFVANAGVTAVFVAASSLVSLAIAGR